MSNGHRRKKPHPGTRSMHASGSPSSDRPKSYAIETEKGTEIRPELVGNEANEEAKRCEKVNKTQLRRFFGAAMSEHRSMETDNGAKVAIALLNAKAHYAAARNQNNEELSRFFNHHAKIVSGKNDFDFFMKHFEAVVAYYTYNAELDKRGRKSR